MAYDEQLADRLRTALVGQPGLEEKRMFGGISFMVAGQMCCGVLKDELIARIDPSDADELFKQPHVRPFDFSGRAMNGMAYVGQPALASDAELDRWVKRAVSYVLTHPREEKHKSGSRRAR